MEVNNRCNQNAAPHYGGRISVSNRWLVTLSRRISCFAVTLRFDTLQFLNKLEKEPNCCPLLLVSIL